MLRNVLKYKLHLLVIMIVLFVQVFFAFEKEGYHMDELISYEMANAEYNPWIVPTQPVGRLAKFMHKEIDAPSFAGTVSNLYNTVKDVVVNRGGSKILSYKADVYEEPVWISKEQFVDYLTTDKNDDFNYISVVFNVKDDNHPPVHFMLLHTMSSVFSGSMSSMLGLIINIIMLVGSMLILMKLGLFLEKEKVFPKNFGYCFGIVSSLMYGCSHAAIATSLLIRMYGVLTFLCLSTFYLHLKKWYKEEYAANNKLLIVVTILGFWTQYFFLFYCLTLSLLTMLMLLYKKRKSETIIYIRSMVLAAIIGVLGYPFAIEDVFRSGRGVEAIENLKGGLGAYCERIVQFGSIAISRCFGNVSIGLGILVIILTVTVVLFVNKKNYRSLLLFFYLPAIGYFFAAAKMSPMYVDRYIMALFPFMVSWLAIFLCVLLQKNKGIKYSTIVLLIGYCVFHILTYDGTYLYKGYERQIQISKEYGDLSCVCLYEGYGFYENVIEFTNYERTLLVKPQELLERRDTESVENQEKMIFLVKEFIPEESFNLILQKYGFNVVEVLVDRGPHGDRVFLCGK